MAATDQNYRNQYGLDIVFAVSSILMLLSIVWMLWDDYAREYKTEQRIYRDVEMAMAQREALIKMPSWAAFEAVTKTVESARDQRTKDQPQIEKLNEEIHVLLPEKERLELTLANLKADLDSKTSFLDIEVEQNGLNSPHANGLRDEISNLNSNIVTARDAVEKQLQEVKSKQRQKDQLEQPLTKAIGNLKKLLDDFDRQAALAALKKWGIDDVIRSLPVLDAYASPTKIEQITLRDLTIDYNFMGVTRFDRCTTCHKGVARTNFTSDNLQGLWYADSSETAKKLAEAHKILDERKKLMAGMDEARPILDKSQLQLSYLSDKVLTKARVSEFSAHPRLDLFVGANSKHPMEKFGCTSCHSGQPSGTSFSYAAHTPNDIKTQHEWVEQHHWESQHMWNFPMLPKRFVESSCLKCHTQVTDLYSDGSKTEAPKLTKGYDLVREFGCYGCHEINGNKGGRTIGPDLRLEPNPPLEKLTVAERAKLFADPDNPPGTMRKVGPSLLRVSEKANEVWMVKWILAPREFRPDTKMPHYYGLANNDVETLKGTGQEKFPDTEVHGIVQYLFKSSRSYVDLINSADDKERIKANEEIVKSLESKIQRKEPLSEEDSKRLQSAKLALSLQGLKLSQPDAAAVKDADAERGRDLFTKKGCLACHSHASTNESDGVWPAAPSEADFGPNLIQLKGKLVGKDGDSKKAMLWLVNWLKNPTLHSPRTRMPITHLTDKEAVDIATWLLAQDVPTDKQGRAPEDLRGSKWNSLKTVEPTDSDLQDLSRVYLIRTLAESEIKDFFAGKLSPYRVKDLGADEQELSKQLSESKDKNDRKDSMLNYVGKKAIGRLGCYGCHDIPGFESAKPIGTPLADWGKKDPTRLAFDDVVNYVNKHYDIKTQVVDKRVDEDGYPLSVAKGPLYERFFYELLEHKTREGFLNQKLLEPRSFDYGRIRAWDDRSRMPQFQFARTKKKAAEDKDTEFKLRKSWAEAMGKELDKNAKPRPAESTADYLARKEKLEADNREAAMTFVLGLVGDPIPLQYLPQPTPDRMAEIKGRQVLEKFNCAGCHVLRPGTYEFKLSKDAQQNLAEQYTKNMQSGLYKDDHFFAEHRAWNQALQNGGIVSAHGVSPMLLSTMTKKPRINLTLSDSLHVPVVDANGEAKALNLRGSDIIPLSPSDMIWPPRQAFQSPEDFKAWEKQYGAHGGAFAALLSDYLKSEDYKDKNKYQVPGPFVPPSLIWQGERTQPDWLYQFLQDPQKVRELTVLRMPKFNMSPQDARTLVDYFAAVEKRVNPDTNLAHPYPKIPQNGDLGSDYWKDQTAKFIERLKKLDEDKKAGGYKDEMKAYEGAWKQMIADWKTEAKNAEQRKKSADEDLKKLQTELKDAKGEDQKQQLKKKVDLAELDAAFWKAEKDRLENLVTTKTPEALQKDWQETQAYALAGYRLLVNQCNKCHGVGNLQAQQQEGQGPSLNFASSRLRPDWSFRWISNPQRFLHYVSAMPQYFKNSEKNAKGEDLPLVPWLPGTHDQQIGAARDALLNLQRISENPLTHYWMQSGGK